MASTSQIDFTNQAITKQDLLKCVTYGVVQGSGTTPAPALTYEEAVISFNWVGGASVAGSLLLAKFGNAVTMRFTQSFAIFTTTATASSTLDTRFRPAATVKATIFGEANGNIQNITLTITTAGAITLTDGLDNAFTGVGSTQSGLFPVTVTYMLI